LRPIRFIGVSPSRRDDRVELALKRADATLEEWFQRSQKATRKATVSFAAFLHRAKRQSAGALRHEVDDLQAGLKKLSTRLDSVEHDATAAPKKRRVRPAPAPKAAASRKAASARKAVSTRKRKKAA
jgi:hypothetical protein